MRTLRIPARISSALEQLGAHVGVRTSPASRKALLPKLGLPTNQTKTLTHLRKNTALSRYGGIPRIYRFIYSLETSRCKHLLVVALLATTGAPARAAFIVSNREAENYVRIDWSEFRVSEGVGSETNSTEEHRRFLTPNASSLTGPEIVRASGERADASVVQAFQVEEALIVWEGRIGAAGASSDRSRDPNENRFTSIAQSSSSNSFLFSIAEPTEVVIQWSTVGTDNPPLSPELGVTLLAVLDLRANDASLWTVTHNNANINAKSQTTLALPAGDYTIRASLMTDADRFSPPPGRSIISGNLTASLTIRPVPEPASLALAVFGLAAMYAIDLRPANDRYFV